MIIASFTLLSHSSQEAGLAAAVNGTPFVLFSFCYQNMFITLLIKKRDIMSTFSKTLARSAFGRLVCRLVSQDWLAIRPAFW